VYPPVSNQQLLKAAAAVVSLCIVDVVYVCWKCTATVFQCVSLCYFFNCIWSHLIHASHHAVNDGMVECSLLLLNRIGMLL